MKIKTSVTLSQELLTEVDRLVAPSGSRSEFIERAVRAWITQAKEREMSRRDLDVINRHAARLNREARDTLAFQGDV